MTNVEKLEHVIESLGGRMVVAERLGVSPVALHFWLTGKQDLPLKRAYKLAKWTDFRVSVLDLRPDLDA